MKKSGRILIVAELAREYGFKDVGGVLLYLVSNSSEFDRAFILIFGEMRTFQNTPCLVISPDILIIGALFLILLCDFVNNKTKTDVERLMDFANGYQF